MNAENIVTFLKVDFYFSLKHFRWQKQAPNVTQTSNQANGVYDKRRECEE